MKMDKPWLHKDPVVIVAPKTRKARCHHRIHRLDPHSDCINCRKTQCNFDNIVCEECVVCVQWARERLNQMYTTRAKQALYRCKRTAKVQLNEEEGEKQDMISLLSGSLKKASKRPPVNPAPMIVVNVFNPQTGKQELTIQHSVDDENLENIDGETDSEFTTMNIKAEPV